jgi:hypothetical protein
MKYLKKIWKYLIFVQEEVDKIREKSSFGKF